MQTMKVYNIWIGLLLLKFTGIFADPINYQRFTINDAASEVTFRYKKYNELIILSAQLNASTDVNLILDSGCNGLILFGKRFNNLVKPFTQSSIAFSGFGDRPPINGSLSLENDLELNGVSGHGLAIVVVPSRGFVTGMPQIDGIIGYDLFRCFEIEVNPGRSTITIRNAQSSFLPNGYLKFNLLDGEVRPMVNGQVNTLLLPNKTLPLLIDTGSQLGLLLKSKQINPRDCKVIGRGLCGYLKGEAAYASEFTIQNQVMASDLAFDITPSRHHEMLSLGMNFLKDYIFIINVAQQFFAIKIPTYSRR